MTNSSFSTSTTSAVRGWTLTDLAAVIALVGIVVALLFPVLLHARENARRSRCASNMQRYATALLHYHDRFEIFPAATESLASKIDDSIRWNYGTTFQLLPWLEETGRYDEILSMDEPPRVDDAHPALQGVISVLQCPVDPSAGTPGLFNDVARCNIMTSRADVAWHNNAGDLDIYYHSDRPPRADMGLYRSAFHPIWGLHHARIMQTRKTRDDISDGIGFTVAASEAVSTPSIPSRNIRETVAFHLMMNTPVPSPPGSCLNDVVDLNDKNLLHESISVSLVGRGNYFCDGRAARSGFCTVLPPNSPSCNNRPNGENSQSSGWGVYSASAYHPGGVNVVFFDSSTRFISESIHAGNANAPLALEPSDPSPYGVWGAMGTIASGEKIQIP